jgi:hypothetical protein
MTRSLDRTAGVASPWRSAVRASSSYALALACAAGRLSAQDTTSVHDATSDRDGWIVGPLVGVPGVGSEPFTEAFTLGFGATRLVPNRPGADLAIGLVPRFLTDGALLLGARAGVGLPLALTRDVFFVPSAGVSAVGGLASEGGGGTAGFYAGAAAVLATGSLGFRAGITLHRFGEGNGKLWLVEFGLMHVPSPTQQSARDP